jgi:hypothetical protein
VGAVSSDRAWDVKIVVRQTVVRIAGIARSRSERRRLPAPAAPGRPAGRRNVATELPLARRPVSWYRPSVAVGGVEDAGSGGRPRGTMTKSALTPATGCAGAEQKLPFGVVAATS